MSGKDMQMIADRWMMESRRLVNWGSYEGYHEFRPSTDSQLPVTLLAGASESGKSTLVDAQISLLYPTGTPFNKASNSGRSERSDYTYLRGMIGVGGSDGVDEPMYLLTVLDAMLAAFAGFDLPVGLHLPHGMVGVVDAVDAQGVETLGAGLLAQPAGERGILAVA